MRIFQTLLLLYGIFFGIVSLGQTINAGNDTIICPGGTANLRAQVSGGSYGTSSYTFQVIPYQPMPFSGGTMIDLDFQGCMASGNDDCWAGPYNIGFNFCFFNQYYSQFWVGSNGWIGFTDPSGHDWTTYTSAPIPNTDPLVPKNCIMAPWEDWFPSIVTPNVFYYVTGTAPNRKLVVYWKDCPMFTCPWSFGTFQIVLNEQNSVIENNIANKSICNFHTATQGVHNIDGTIAFTASGRNSTVWATNNESTRFVPSGIKWYSGGYPGGTFLGYGATLNVSPVVTTTYTAIVETCGGFVVTDTVTVYMIDAGFSYPHANYCRSGPDPFPVILQPGGTFSATPAGLVFVNTGTGQIDVSASAPGNYIVTYTITKPTCIESATWPVTIIDIPDPPAPVDDTVARCGPGMVILEVIPDPGDTISWWDAPAGGNLLPFTGPSINVFIGSTTHFYAEATTVISNCTSITRTDITALVKPFPAINNPVLLYNRCSGKSTNILLSSTIPGSTFSWTATASSLNLTGYSNGSGSAIAQIIHNSGTTIDTVYYQVTPAANGCTGTPVVFKVAVIPLPALANSTLDTTICSGQPTSISLLSNIPGGTFTWDCLQPSGNVTGWAANTGPGSNAIIQVLTSIATIKDSVIYHLVPEANGCQGTVKDFKVYVNPVPELTVSPLLDSICSGETTNIPLTSTIPGTAFSWTSAQGVGNITGNSNNTGNLIDDHLVNPQNTAGSILYTIIPSTSACTGAAASFTMWVKPLPHLTNTPLETSLCSGQPIGLTLLSDVGNTSFTWTVTGSSPNLTGYSNQPAPTTLLNQTLTNSGYNTEWANYLITPSAAGCQGPDSNYIVRVFPVPDVANTTTYKEICSDNPTDIDLISHISNTLFTWTATPSSPNITGFSNSPNPDVRIDDTLVNTGGVNESVAYHTTPQANGCTGSPVDFIVTAVPTPLLTNNPLDTSICNNQPTGLTLLSNVLGTQFMWTAIPSSGFVSGYSNSAAPGTLINQTLINAGFNPETVTYQITPESSVCPVTTTNFTVEVFPVPDLYFTPLAQTVCEKDLSDIRNLSHVTGTTFSWVATASSPNLAGYSNGSGDRIAQTVDNNGGTIESVTYQVTPEANGCPPGTTLPVVLTVNPRPAVTNPVTSYHLCNNTALNIALLADVTGSTFAWRAFASSPNLTGYSNGTSSSITHTLVNTGYAIDSVTYRIAATANACPGDSTDIHVVVYPVADVIFTPAAQDLCSGQTTGISLTSNVANTTYSWTATPSSPDVTGHAGGTGDLIQQTLVNSGFTPQFVTYEVTPVANSCTGDPGTYVVNVYSETDVSNTPMFKEICNNNNTGVDLTSHVSGTLFTWTATGSSGNIQGFTNSTVPSTHIGDDLINLGDVNETVTYHITPHANGCDGNEVDYVVTVVPSPYLTNSPLRQPQCNNLNTNITLESNVVGTQFTWTCTQTSGNITGYSPGTTPAAAINQLLLNSSFVTDSVIYHVTPENSGCIGSATDYAVVVYPVPDLYFIPDGETVCEEEVSNLSLLSHVTGTTFSWTATPSSVTLSGFSNDTGNVIAQVITNSGTTIESVTYQVTPAANGCPPGNTLPVILEVVPKPVITNSTTRFDQCNNATTAISLQSDLTFSSFAWRAFASSANLSGFSSGTGENIIQTLTNNGFTIDSVTFRAAATASSCPGDSTDFTVIVYPVPDIGFTPDGQSVCSGHTTDLSLYSQVVGTSFTWTATGSDPDVSGYASGSGTTIQQTLINTGYMIPTVTYQVTPSINGCHGIQNSSTVTVNPLPVLSLAACIDTITTTNAQPIPLAGGIPRGGVFSGPGVDQTTGILYPGIAGPGSHQISYSYTNDFNCSDSSSLMVTVYQMPAFSCGDPLTDIRDNQTYPTVDIDGQCWMAADLNFGTGISASQMQRDNCVNEKYCYNNSPGNCLLYGGLYQWDEVMRYADAATVQGMCPPGWHIPSEVEWNELFTFFTSNAYAGDALKAGGSSGFNTLTSGIRFLNTFWKFPVTDTTLQSKLYWSSTKHGLLKAWAHGLNEVVANTEYTPSVSLYPAMRSNAFAVRCIED